MSDASTSDLAARLYERWRQGQDFYEPAPADRETVAAFNARNRAAHAPASKPRPRWDRLDTVQQNIWRAVALEAVLQATSVTAVRANSQAQA